MFATTKPVALPSPRRRSLSNTMLLGFAPHGQDQLRPGIALIIRGKRKLYTCHPRCAFALGALLDAKDSPGDVTSAPRCGPGRLRQSQIHPIASRERQRSLYRDSTCTQVADARPLII
jgi:hypothetical protein